MASSSEEERRANRRFWFGVAGFLAILVAILALGLVCGADQPASDPNPNAIINYPADA